MADRLDKAEVVRWLNEPADGDGPGGVTRYLYDVWRAREDLREAFPDPTGADAERLVEWAHTSGRTEVPIPPALLPRAPRAIAQAAYERPPAPRSSVGSHGVNVVGFLRSDLGIGEAARLSISALDSRRIPVLPLDVCDTFLSERTGHGHEFAVAEGSLPAYPVNLICINGEELATATAGLGPRLFDGRYSIGFWWWEVEGATPTRWLPAALFLDEVWTASRHVTEAIRPFCPVRVEQVTLPVIVPAPSKRLDREALGLPGGFLFLTIFDYFSSFERKNPTAVVEAFRSAFTPGSGASLVVKAVNSHAAPEARATLAEVAGDHPDIHLVDRYVASEEKNAMLAACDCYTSLHRSEGFGLPLAEAMYLGKPAIATGYSGNLEFMTPDNSYLVEHTLIDVGDGPGQYSGQGRWAEPSVSHAAELMRRVFEHRDEASERGARAAREIRQAHSPEAAGRSMEEHLERIRTGRPSENSPSGAQGERDPKGEPSEVTGAPVPRTRLRAAAARVPAARRTLHFARRARGRLTLRSAANAEALQQAALEQTALQQTALEQAVERVERRLAALEEAEAHGRATTLAALRRLEEELAREDPRDW